MTLPVRAILNSYNCPPRSSVGAEVKFVCPFHERENASCEHNASFNQTTGMWHCYSCKASGDLIGFILQSELCTVDEAKEILKTRFGYDVDEAEFLSDEDDDFFVEYQADDLKLPPKARLIESDNPYIIKHGFDGNTLRALRVSIDYATDPWGKYLFDRAVLLPYTHNNKLVGWAYKFVKGKYKYLDGFKRGRYLYGFDIAKKSGHVIVVEGPRDVWRLMQHGYPAVAISGSTPTEHQITMLYTYWSKVFVCLDGDKAGRAGTKLLARKLSELSEMKAIVLPDGTDPCDFKTKKEWKKARRIVEMDEYLELCKRKAKA